jgi:hypothetical protein
VIRWGAIARRIFFSVCLPTAAWGQRVSSSLDIGGAAMRYADSLTANGGSLSPALAVEWPRATLGGAATFSHFASGWSSQGALNASGFSHAAGLFVAEFEGTAGASAHQDGTRTGQTLGGIRGHLMANHTGAWLGVGMGRTWDSQSWRSVLNAELGGWLRAGAATLVASTTPTSVDDTIRYTDSQISIHWSRSVVELGGEAGFRAGATGAVVGGSGRRWGSVATTAWLSPNLGVVLAGGTYPIDLTQGFPGGRFVTLSLRIRSAPPAPESSRLLDGSAAAGGGSTEAERPFTFRALPGAGGQVQLEVQAPAARSVEVSGDFTSWRPVSLSRAAGGRWVVSLPMVSGTHQINIRVNGDRWLVPPGLPPITDEFGGSVGLLVVERKTP